jgi:hypothetical protein
LAWWGWVVVGAALLASELFVDAGFYLVFLGLAALGVGLLGAAGLAGPAAAQWGLFGLLAVAFLLGFRRPVQRWLRPSPAPLRAVLVGEVARAREPIGPGAEGRAELHGSTWTARNTSSTALAPGGRARVVAVEGLVLEIRPEE